MQATFYYRNVYDQMKFAKKNDLPAWRGCCYGVCYLARVARSSCGTEDYLFTAVLFLFVCLFLFTRKTVECNLVLFFSVPLRYSVFDFLIPSLKFLKNCT